jgi:hypothetical protein
MSMTSLQIYRYLSKASFVSLFFNQSAELPSASLPQSESRHIYGRLTNPLNDYPGLLSFDASSVSGFGRADELDEEWVTGFVGADAEYICLSVSPLPYIPNNNIRERRETYIERPLASS